MSDRQPSEPPDPRERFLRGFATTVKLERQLLAEPGTTIAALVDRAGTGVLTCYWADQHAIIWADPAVVDDEIAALASDERTATPKAQAELASAAGLVPRADADMRVLNHQLPSGKSQASPPVPAPYRQHWLRPDEPDHVELVRQFADRSDPVDVEQAALDDLDNFDEAAINVLTVDDDPELVAYASACDWDVAFAAGVGFEPATTLTFYSLPD